MEIENAIFERRSIRKYSGESISDDKINLILRAAMYAPSARNLQPWHYVFSNERSDLIRLSQIHPYGKMLMNASHAILVCGDTSIEPSVEYILADCSAAIQNMLLMTHALGFGSVWLGVWPRQERVAALSDFYSLPTQIVPVGLVCIGVPAEQIPIPERFKADRIHYRQYGNQIK